MEREDFKILRTRKYFPFPSDWNILVHSSKEAAEICGLSFSNIYFLHDRGFVTALYSTKEWLEIGDSILKKIFNNEKFISDIYSEQQKRGEQLKEISNKIVKKLGEEDDASVESLGQEALQIKSHWLQYNNLELCWYIGADFLKEYVLKEITETNSQFSPEDFQSIVVPPEETFSAEEEIDIVKAGIRIAGTNTEIDEEIDNLLEKYYWIPFGYDGPTKYDEAHYSTVLDDLVGRNTLESLKVQLEKLRFRRDFMLREKKRILDNYKIDDNIGRMIDDLGTMIAIADDRKQYISYAQIAYDRLLERFAEILKLDKTTLKYLDTEEIIDFCDDKERIISLADQRKDLFLDGVENHKMIRNVGDKVLDIKNLLLENLSENIKGTVASRGFSSVIKANVKVLFVPEDMLKVENGDIIVSPMTTPQFTSAVRKASAVVTDEGGITCHAAIISRELGIPCIIGTKIATKVLKDGDMVEVDANKGTVRKLEKINEK